MTMNSSSVYKGTERSFCIRMKSTLTKRGCHFKSSGYRVVLVLSHLRAQYSFGHNRKQQPPTILGMLALAIALPPPSVNEVRLESDMFVTRLAFDFRIAHCEPRISDLLNYSPEEVTGKNMYALCHGQDVQLLRKCHIDLIKKGQVMTPYYRLICKTGGYVWMQTCATVICNKNSEDQSIICVNYVLSHIEYEGCILDYSQLPPNLKPDDPSTDQGRGGPTPECDKKDETPPTRELDPTDDTPDGHSASDHILVRLTSKSDSRRQSTPIDPGELYDKEAKNLSTSDKTKSGGRKRKLGSSPNSPGGEFLANGASPTSPGQSGSEAEEGTVSRPWKRAESNGGLSVKELEDAMNKHLPAEPRSAIQWIGGPQPSPLPASSLLRQIYVNRESVIRSGSHVSRPPYYSEALPTPPSSDIYSGEQFPSYSGYGDTYSATTPPASVSPRDKYPPGLADSPAFSEAAAAAAAAAMPHMHHYEQHLPLKPQVFVHPGGPLDPYVSPEQQLYHPFHLYHPSPPKSSAAGTNSWYSLPET